MSNPVTMAMRGLRAWISLFGERGRPVDESVARPRAEICAPCQLNQVEEGWFEKATVRAGVIVKDQLAIQRDQKLDLPGLSEKLHICQACHCYLPLKVFVPDQKIVEETTEDALKIMRDKKPDCWVLKLMEAAK